MNPLFILFFSYLDGLGDSADLVDLEQQSIASLLLHRSLDAHGVSDSQVIAHNLNISRSSQVRPGLPVVLVKGILDRDDRVVGRKLLVQRRQLLSRQQLGLVRVGVLEVQIVLAIDIELGRRNVHADLDLVGIACLGDRGLEQLEPLGVVLDVGREATLVANVSGVLAVLGLDDGLEGVVDLGADLHGLGKGFGARGQDHEFLHGQLVAGVGAAVDDIHSRDGENDLLAAVTGQVGNVAVQRNTLGGGAGLEDGEGDTEDGVGAILGLIGGAVELEEEVVDGGLVLDVEFGLDEGRAEMVIDVLDGGQDTWKRICKAIKDVGSKLQKEKDNAHLDQRETRQSKNKRGGEME